MTLVSLGGSSVDVVSLGSSDRAAAGAGSGGGVSLALSRRREACCTTRSHEVRQFHLVYFAAPLVDRSKVSGLGEVGGALRMLCALFSRVWL